MRFSGEIKIDGVTVPYIIRRSSAARRLTVRVLGDGTVKVTSPPTIGKAYIEKSLTEISDFILKNLAENGKREADFPALSEYSDGEEFTLFGKRAKLAVFAGKSAVCSYENGVLTVVSPHPSDAMSVRRAVNGFLRAVTEEKVLAASRECFARMNLKTEFPRIVFRNAVARWGRCTPSKNELMFNYALHAVPIDAVEYVVYHEFAHFFVLNHSKDFYAVLGSFLPDYKRRRALLKNFRLTDKRYYI